MGISQLAMGLDLSVISSEAYVKVPIIDLVKYQLSM